MINTKDQLKDYIYRQLGAPIITVELTDDQLDDCINTTIKQFSEFAYDGELEETVLLDVNGAGVYQLPVGIQSIEKVAVGTSAGGLTNFGGNFGSGYVPDIWSQQYFSSTQGISGIINSVIGVSTTQSMLEHFMGDDLMYDFNSHRKILRLFEPYAGPILVYYSYEYMPQAVDYIYDQTWVKAMSVAQARMLQSTVVGKYSQALVGGAMINYDMMRSLAEQEIEQLKEDLQLKYAGPAPIMIS